MISLLAMQIAQGQEEAQQQSGFDAAVTAENDEDEQIELSGALCPLTT